MCIALTGQSLNALCDETCSLLIDIGIKPPLERPSFLEGIRGEFDPKPAKAYWKVILSTNRVLKKIKRELGKETGSIQLLVDNLTLSLTRYCKKIFSNSLLEQIELGFSTGDEKFSDANFLFLLSRMEKRLKNYFLTKKDIYSQKTNLK